MEYTSNILLFIQIASVVLLFAETIYVLIQSPSRVQVYLVVLGFSTVVMQVGYIMEITSQSREAALLGVYFSYLGKPFALLSALLFIAEYCGRPIPQRWIVPLALLHGLFPVLICTNDLHLLYYSSVEFDRSCPYSPLILGHGPLYFLYMALVVGHMVADLFYIIRELHESSTRAGRLRALYLVGMVVSSMVGYVVFLTGITNGCDTTMLGATVGTICLTVLFFRYRLFDALSLAKERALDDADTGLLVLNEKGRLIYSNNMVNRLMKHTFTLSGLRGLPEGHSILRRGERVYDTSKNTVTSRGSYFGETVEITDITERFNYSARLEQDVELRTRELQRIQRSVLASFAGIVEARDNSTGAHIKRMSHYVELIARSLAKDPAFTGELDENTVTCLVDVAPLHDIGKIGIPDSILQKPGRLDEEEYELIKNHTIEGARVIDECLRGVEREEYVSMARKVALYHHERWDGRGYPEGLSGEDIPLCARIVAVADVYDALCSERCYKPSYSGEQARSIIREGQGTQFDPRIVDAFFRALDKMSQV